MPVWQMREEIDDLKEKLHYERKTRSLAIYLGFLGGVFFTMLVEAGIGMIQ